MGVVIHGYISARDRQSRASGRAPKLVAVERALAHVKYIQHRPGEDKDPGGRRFFDELDEDLDGRALRKAIRKMEDSKVVVHKLALAPEIDPLDKRQYTREVMHELAAEKGLDLKWFAVEHNNTAHHHIHVVLLGKDGHGKDVRIEKADYARLKGWGDRYLERWQPIELEMTRSKRRHREAERLKERQREDESLRRERIRDGLDLPWMHRQIIREQLEPYSKWKSDRQEIQRDRTPDKTRDQTEKPYLNDTITAAEKEWSMENSLSELRQLHTHLWDNYDERIPLPEYKKLVGWIKEKEQHRAKDRDGRDSRQDKSAPAKNKQSFEYRGERFSKNTSYDKLTKLANRLREQNVEQLPLDDYHNLRSWIENADRARWARVVDRQLDIAKTRVEQDAAAKTAPNANRYVNPLQQQMMANPVVGLFMQGASLANQLVRWIDLKDNRDPLKEARDTLEDAKKDRHKDHVSLDRKRDQREWDKQVIENIDKAIDENKEMRENRRKEKEKQRDKKDRGLDFMR